VMGEETLRLGPGSFVAAPIGFVHTFGNPGNEPARVLNMHAPSRGFHDWLRTVN
jgi:mannose-6-phosphate isomerase-like protein (cupin superfamily)